MKKVYRVNMSDLKIIEELLKKEYETLGGRGLTSRIVTEEVPPSSHPLGKENKLVFAPGLLAGTSAACSGRLSVGARDYFSHSSQIRYQCLRRSHSGSRRLSHS